MGRPWVEATQSLAHYRRGREKEALSLADHSLTFGTGGGWNRAVVAHMVRAMTLRRLGRDEEARQALESAEQIIHQIKGLGEGDYGIVLGFPVPNQIQLQAVCYPIASFAVENDAQRHSEVVFSRMQ